jgi:hypothetical protein
MESTHNDLLELLIQTIRKVAGKLWLQDPKASFEVLQDLLAQVSNVTIGDTESSPETLVLGILGPKSTELGLDETTTEANPKIEKLLDNSTKVPVAEIDNTNDAPCRSDQKTVPSTLTATAPPSGTSESSIRSSKSKPGQDQGSPTVAAKRGLKRSQASISTNDNLNLHRLKRSQSLSQCIVPNSKIIEKTPRFQGKSRNDDRVVAITEASDAKESCLNEETMYQLTSGPTIYEAQSPQNTFRDTIALFKGIAVNGDAMELA